MGKRLHFDLQRIERLAHVDRGGSSDRTGYKVDDDVFFGHSMRSAATLIRRMTHGRRRRRVRIRLFHRVGRRAQALCD